MYVGFVQELELMDKLSQLNRLPKIVHNALKLQRDLLDLCPEFYTI